MLDSMRHCFLVIPILAFLLINLVGSTTVGVATIRAPAVIVGNNTGALTRINLTVTYGSGKVDVIGPAEIGNSTSQSAQAAAHYAASYLNVSFQNYNFTYNITDAGANVSGPSAGAAMTLLAISALSHKQLRPDFTITGTISSTGYVGVVGGVYNKVGAASGDGMSLMLVPSVGAGSEEDMLYLLAQANFNIPLVQVSNISGASLYAFNKNISGTTNETKYNFYTNYNTNELHDATLACRDCNASAFRHLASSTLNYTAQQIRVLNSDPNFKGVAAQLSSVLNESKWAIQHNYLYVGSNIAFLDYIDAFYFSNHDANISRGLQVLLSARKYCNELVPPTMTNGNYEYVLGAELRQLWANYTINTTIAAYNITNMDSDDMLSSIYSAGQANGWCKAAGTVYATQQPGSSDVQVQPSRLLNAVALEKISRAQGYGPSMYLNTAQLAYKQGNYPVAILDADYAYALLGVSSNTDNMTSNQIASAASALLAGNATYGVWATEFSKETLFYINESKLASNSTQTRAYALQAYSAASLAQNIGTDMLLIYQSLAPSSGSMQNLSTVTAEVTRLSNMIFILLAVLILIAVLVSVNIVLLALSLKGQRSMARRNRSQRRSRR